MIFSAEPSSFSAYQTRTNEQKESFSNVWAIPKKAKCVDCGKHRTEVSGKYKKRGFVCVMCK